MLSRSGYIAQLGKLVSFELPADANPYMALMADLDVDSISVLEVVVVSEAFAACLFPPDEFPEIVTLDDAYNYYVRCCGRGDAVE